MSGNKQACENGLAILGSLIMCTVYTNTYTLGQYKHRLSILSAHTKNSVCTTGAHTNMALLMYAQSW